MRCLAVALACAFVLAGCASPNTPDESGDVAIQRLSASNGSFESFNGLDTAESRVIRSTAEWASVWARIYQNRSPQPALPNIDFLNEQVVVVSLGTRPSSGYSIRIAGVSRRGNGV